MEKIIVIAGKNVSFKSNGAVTKRYKMQFGRDFFKDLLGMGFSNANFEEMNDEEKIDMIREIDFDMFYDMAWVLAKTSDNSIPDPLSWLDSFDEFPIIDILPELQELLASSISSKKK